jgi:hypothetical protein
MNGLYFRDDVPAAVVAALGTLRELRLDAEAALGRLALWVRDVWTMIDLDARPGGR